MHGNISLNGRGDDKSAYIVSYSPGLNESHTRQVLL